MVREEKNVNAYECKFPMTQFTRVTCLPFIFTTVSCNEWILSFRLFELLYECVLCTCDRREKEIFSFSLLIPLVKEEKRFTSSEMHQSWVCFASFSFFLSLCVCVWMLPWYLCIWMSVSNKDIKRWEKKDEMKRAVSEWVREREREKEKEKEKEGERENEVVVTWSIIINLHTRTRHHQTQKARM